MSWSPRANIAARPRQDITDRSATADSRLPKLANEPIEKADRNDPTLPSDRTEPVEEMDRIDPRERIDRIEFWDLIDHNEPSRRVMSP
jgi:hypothetical protein